MPLTYSTISSGIAKPTFTEAAPVPVPWAQTSIQTRLICAVHNWNTIVWRTRQEWKYSTWIATYYFLFMCLHKLCQKFGQKSSSSTCSLSYTYCSHRLVLQYRNDKYTRYPRCYYPHSYHHYDKGPGNIHELKRGIHMKYLHHVKK